MIIQQVLWTLTYVANGIHFSKDENMRRLMQPQKVFNEGKYQYDTSNALSRCDMSVRDVK